MIQRQGGHDCVVSQGLLFRNSLICIYEMSGGKLRLRFCRMAHLGAHCVTHWVITRNWIVFSWSHTRIWPKGLTSQSQCLPQTRQHFPLYDSCRAFFKASCCVLGFPFIREQGEKCTIPTVFSDCSLVVGCPLRESLPLAHPSHSSCRQFILTNTGKLGDGKWKLQAVEQENANW